MTLTKRPYVPGLLADEGPGLIDLKVMRGNERTERPGHDDRNTRVHSWQDLLSDVRTKALLSSARDPVVICDGSGKVLHINPPGESLFQRPREEIVNGPLAKLISAENRDHVSHMLKNSRTQEGNLVSHEQQLDAINAHGEAIPVELRMLTGRIDGQLFHCCVFSDRSEMLMTSDRLQRLADHDTLTGLFNRRRFCEELDQQLKLSSRYNGVVGSLLFIDLDYFKEINDTLGHEAGDDVLRHFSELLKDTMRNTDIVGRLGGDEFAILLTQTPSERAGIVAEKLCRSIRESMVHTAGREVRVTASIGAASFPEHAANEKDLFACADSAMYRTKERGRNGSTLFSTKMSLAQPGKLRLLWEDRIRRALQDDTFFLVLQPIKPLRPGLGLMYESLIRMRAGDGSCLPPGDFLPIAERYGMIVDVDRWVLNRVINGLIKAPIDQFPAITMNLSALALGHKAILEDLRRAHASRRIDTTRLTLEITESAVIADFDKAKEFLEEVRSLGFRLAIDDFGTGFSSLARLREMKVDYLKIAMDFVREVAQSGQDRHLVKAMVEMARGLGQLTIAEGVETGEAMAVLKILGVDYAQGFYISKPMVKKNF